MEKLHQFGIKLVDLMLSSNNFFVVKVSLKEIIFFLKKKKTTFTNKLGEYFPCHSRQLIEEDKNFVLNWVRIFSFQLNLLN
jgi:hypothetical protein